MSHSMKRLKVLFYYENVLFKVKLINTETMWAFIYVLFYNVLFYTSAVNEQVMPQGPVYIIIFHVDLTFHSYSTDHSYLNSDRSGSFLTSNCVMSSTETSTFFIITN